MLGHQANFPPFTRGSGTLRRSVGMRFLIRPQLLTRVEPPSSTRGHLSSSSTPLGMRWRLRPQKAIDPLSRRAEGWGLEVTGP
jgi:hypothetical protein